MIIGRMKNDFLKDRPLYIAGPCSAESEEQLFSVASRLREDHSIKLIRAGIWKPRTRPGSFSGVGEEGLKWMSTIQKKLDVKFCTEVASAAHVDLALKHDITTVWIGARTTVNPFMVQEIADALKGTGLKVMIKNPVNPDLSLWIGGIERILHAGIEDITAIHRGFSVHQSSQYRNAPIWQIPLELKSKFPDIPVIIDPSHIAGHSKYVPEISQRAFDLLFDGLMVEVHENPPEALSDAKQQIAPQVFGAMIASLKMRDQQITDEVLASMREEIDHADMELINLFSKRLDLSQQIGEYKKTLNASIFQPNRWNEIMKTRPEWGGELGMNKEFIEDIFRRIHQESVRQQTELFKDKNEKK